MFSFEPLKILVMKKLVGLMLLLAVIQVGAQANAEIVKHYEAFYKQMKIQGDMQGVINALTHLNVLQPENHARKDTLAMLYMNDGRHMQALNTIGIELKDNDSDMAVEVKAVSLQALNQVERAIEHFEVLYRRNPNVLIAYELADMKIQLNKLPEASVNITYGIANSGPDVMRTYYESQQPYQVPAKAGFTYLKGLVKFRENPETNIDAAVALLDEALAIAPNFNLAKISKDALIGQKNAPKKED
jgi:tetratricopeptide (TPR) repeat protein